jgi:pilus assembly protein TadC
VEGETVILVLAVGLAVLVLFGRGPDHLRDPRPSSELDVVRLLTVAVAAGLPLRTALAEISSEVSGPLRQEIGDILRDARLEELSAALARAPGRLGPLARHLASATAAGTPILGTLAAHAASVRERDRGRSLRKARLLPVQLVIPLTLLLLPGFAAVVLGPPILEQLAGIGAP